MNSGTPVPTMVYPTSTPKPPFLRDSWWNLTPTASSRAEFVVMVMVPSSRIGSNVASSTLTVFTPALLHLFTQLSHKYAHYLLYSLVFDSSHLM
jgi:hypothetical protein